MDKKSSKKELKELKKLRELELAQMEKRQNMIKYMVIGFVSLLFVGFFGFMIYSAKQKQVVQQSQPVVFTQTGQTTGSESAQLTITEFADLQCPACAAYHPVVKQLLSEYDGKIKLVYKHFPLISIHKNAVNGAKAAEAAGKQGKFWEMEDMLYTKQAEWSTVANPLPVFEGYAQELGLNIEQFRQDYASKEIADAIEEQRQEGTRLGVMATPTFFINGQKIENPQGLPGFRQIIEDRLQEAQ